MGLAGMVLLCAALVGMLVNSATVCVGETIQADANGNIFVNGIAGTPEFDGGNDEPVVYTLPFTANPGDIVIVNGASATDLIHFRGDNTMDFYSKNGTLLAAAANSGATNIKVQSVSGLKAGQQINLDLGASEEFVTIASVGTSGATGTGVTLTAPLEYAHASGIVIQGDPLNLGDVAVFPTISATHVVLAEDQPTVWAPGVNGIGGNSSDASLEYLFFKNEDAPAAPLPPIAPAGLALMAACGIGMGWQKMRRGRRAARMA